MKQYIDTITDELSSLPIPDAEVYVYADNGDIALLYAADGETEVGNPLITNAQGEYSFYQQASEFTAVVYYGGRLRRRLRLLVGGGYTSASQTAAAAALAAAGVGEYADTADGLAATSIGETFWVDQGDGTGQVYRHDAGPVATALQKFIIDPTDAGAADIFAGGVPTAATLAASGGAALVGTATGGSVETTRKPVVWARPTGGDDTASLNAALAALDTSGGKAAVLDLSAGFATISGPLTIPTRCTIRGNGTRNSGLNLSGATARIVVDSVDRAGLMDIRIFGASNVTRLIELKTTTGDASAFTMENVEVVGSTTDGQEGIFLSATGGRIITECSFSNILLKSLDRPLRDLDTEGNFWAALTIDQYAFAQARSAIEAQALASHYQARIAGAPFAGSVGMTQSGAGCLIDLAVDIGSGATALNVAGIRNNIRLSRPEALTPRGTVAKGNILLDEGESLNKRISALGITTPVAGDFSLSDFGNAATVTAITGSDQSVQFTVNSSGTGQAQYPTITYTFADGSWPSHPLGLFVTRVGGNQIETSGYFAVSITSSGWVFRWAGTPVDGEAYQFCVGLL